MSSKSASVRRTTIIEERFQRLADGFPRYVEIYDQRGPFSQEQLNLHLQTIHRRHELGSAKAAARDARFAELLHATLRAWRIGVRASKLAPLPRFAELLACHADELGALDLMAIDDSTLNSTAVAERIGRLVAALGITDNRAKLVAGTKTLHHLLPDLIPPMDRAWTGRFLGIHAPEWQSPRSQSWILATVFSGLANVACTVNPQQFVGSGWRSSRTKVLDNALIGFCMSETSAPRTGKARALSPRGRAATGPTRSSYSPLGDWLDKQGEEAASLAFSELEELLGRDLPHSARAHRAWWGNHRGNPQARAWLGAGWRLEAVDVRGERVRFSRAN